MKKRDVTIVTWNFGFTTGSSVTMPAFDDSGRETGELEALGMIRISSCRPDDGRKNCARVEIFTNDPNIAHTASVLVKRDLHQALHVNCIVNEAAYVPLRRNEPFLDGAIRVAQEFLSSLKTRVRSHLMVTSDWEIANFSIRQHTFVYLPRPPLSKDDKRHGWYPIETCLKRKHGLD